MKAAQLLDEAYKSSHYAADLTEQLYRSKPCEPKDQLEYIEILLEQSRALNASAQALEQLARGHKAPKTTP